MRFADAIDRLAGAVVERRGRALLLGLMILVVGAMLASRLELEASYTAMVPDDEVEVAESRNLVGSLQSTQVLTLIVWGEQDSRREFARRAARTLEKQPDVLTVELEMPVEQFERRWFATLPPSDQQRLADEVTAAAKAEWRARNPLVADLGPADPWSGVEELVEELRESGDTPVGETRDRFRTTDDGQALLVTIRPRVTMLTPIGDFEGIIASLEGALEDVDLPAGVRWELSGQMLVALDEYRLVQRDLAFATSLAFVLVVLLLLVATRRWQAVPTIAVPLIVGLAATLGLTALTVGRLNIVSAFMLPALLGLGVDYCIHLQAAYESALRSDTPERSMVEAIREQWRPCGVAALTTAAGFAALLLCQFDGISEFGVIAGIGVLSMYVSCFLLLPPIAVTLIRTPRSARQRRTPARRARPLLVAATVALILAVAGVGQARFHNDFRALRGELPSDARHHELMEQRGGPFEPTLLGATSQSDARRLAELARARTSVDSGRASVGRVVSVTDFLPSTPPKRRAEMLDALDRLAPTAADERERLELLRAWGRGEAWTPETLPDWVSTTLRPRPDLWLVAMYSTEELHAEDQFRKWRDHIDAIRSDAAEEEIAFSVADKWSIVTKMVELIRNAVAPMTAAALALVTLVMVVTRRREQRIVPPITAVAVGVVACAGAAGWLGLPFNIFNIVVLPAVFGIGIDNAVQMSDAIATAKSSADPQIVRRAAACTLSAATTAVGFGAMLVAGHPGIESLGTMSLIGIAATFTASTLALPAWLLLGRENEKGRA